MPILGNLLLLLLLPALVYSYHCYDQKCWGVGTSNSSYIACNLEWNHCKSDNDGGPLCLEHFDTVGVMCGDQCKCEYDPRGSAGCHCPNKYILILAVLLVGVALSGISWFAYYRCRGRRSATDHSNNELYGNDI